MVRRNRWNALLIAICFVTFAGRFGTGGTAQAEGELPEKDRPLVSKENSDPTGGVGAAPENSNSLIKEYRGKLKFSCSSFWPSWGPEKAFDGKPLKSWFTERRDAAVFGRTPWVAVEFPHAVTMTRVTLLANREPPWQVGYTILVGRLELIDKEGKVLYSRDDEVGGERPDMEVRPREPVRGVVKLRFTSLKDQGDQNPYEDIAIGEILVE